MVGTCTARDLVPASVSARGEEPPPPRVRVSRRSRLVGTASLYINRGRYVHAILCPRPCVAAKPPPRVAAMPPRAAMPRVAALRLIDPRKLYSILRPGSINR